MGSRFGALAGEEYDKIAPVIACTLPALTDPIPERKKRELAGEVTSELQVVGKAASIAIQTWVRNNHSWTIVSVTAVTFTARSVHSRAADPDTLHFHGPAAARARSRWRSASCQLWLARLRPRLLDTVAPPAHAGDCLRCR